MNINDECFKRDLGHYMPFPFNSYRNNITLSTRSLEHYMTFLFVPAVRYGEPFLDQVHYLTSKKFYKAGQCVCVCDYACSLHMFAVGYANLSFYSQSLSCKNAKTSGKNVKVIPCHAKRVPKRFPN